MPQAERIWRHDGDRGLRLALTRKDVEDHGGGVDALSQRLGAGGLDCG
jgi:hypothetical protein